MQTRGDCSLSCSPASRSLAVSTGGCLYPDMKYVHPRADLSALCTHPGMPSSPTAFPTTADICCSILPALSTVPSAPCHASPRLGWLHITPRADTQEQHGLLKAHQAPPCARCTPSYQTLRWGEVPASELQQQTAVQGAGDAPGEGYNRSTYILCVVLFRSKSWCCNLWHQPQDERTALNFTNPLILLCLQLEALTYADINFSIAQKSLSNLILAQYCKTHNLGFSRGPS